MKLDKIINIIRNLNEEAPAMSVSASSSSSPPGIAGITGEPPVYLKKKKRPPIIARGLMPGARKRWSGKG